MDCGLAAPYSWTFEVFFPQIIAVDCWVLFNIDMDLLVYFILFLVWGEHENIEG